MSLSGYDLDKITRMLSLLDDEGGAVRVDTDVIPLVDELSGKPRGALVHHPDGWGWTYEPTWQAERDGDHDE